MNQLLLTSLLLAVATAVNAGCSPGYIQREGGGNCYIVKNSWWEWWYYADHICKAEGGWLVTIRNEDDSVWVNKFFADNRRHLCGDWYWIGANDVAQEGKWRWTEDGSEVSYSNWMAYEPNNDGDEDGVEVYSGNRKWNDNKTGGALASRLCFICEKKPTSN